MLVVILHSDHRVQVVPDLYNPGVVVCDNFGVDPASRFRRVQEPLMSQESTAGPSVPHLHIVAYMNLLLDWSKGVARHHDRQDLENDTGIDFLSSYSCYVKWLVQVNVRFSACIQTLGRKVVHAQG